MNWKDEIRSVIEDNNDDPSELVHTMTDDEYTREFNGGYGGTEGCSFTAWTDHYVYFPVQYDGSEWAGSAPRHPCEERMDHQGGG
jgi:hypothetical protein